MITEASRPATTWIASDQPCCHTWNAVTSTITRSNGRRARTVCRRGIRTHAAIAIDVTKKPTAAHGPGAATVAMLKTAKQS